ncbi:50S ribosomal protein L19e [Candidatus Micrarchaeota archaeon]|nr:50S ribosomal protein L19e [Candidatus Micrarchaeota archaeon]
MMTLLSIKRIASRLLKKGINKIRIKQEEVPRASEALTAEDVRSMIKDKVIYATPKQGVSRARAKVKHAQVKKGRRRGSGTRKGKKYSRISTKELWMRKVRTQRKKLKELYDNGLLDSQTRKKLYYMIKGNMFKSKNAFMTYINEHKMLKDKNKGD